MNLGKETETLEFKKTTGEMREAMISISSILNKHGIGTLYFGVKPNGDVCGQDVSESSLRDVSRSVYESIRPQIYPAIEEIVLDGKHLIRVEFNGNNTPYSAAGRYYLRTADEDREVTPEELKSFFVSNEYVRNGKNPPLPLQRNRSIRMRSNHFGKRPFPSEEYRREDILARSS